MNVRYSSQPVCGEVGFWGLSACTNRYEPVRRAVGGGLLGGCHRGASEPGAALGAAIGRAVGVVGSAATTLPPPGYYAHPGD